MNDLAATASARTVRRRPLARTLALPRWREYDRLLREAREAGWTMMDLEAWIDSGGPGGRVLILRHDVDQHPATALRMARIEARHGVRSTWYFRWRTCSPVVIRKVRAAGGGVGFHYETLTRLALTLDLEPADIGEDLVVVAREELRREVAAFRLYFGSLDSFAAHGDTRVSGLSNQVLVHGEDPAVFGVRFDANEALSRHRLGMWLTDRSSAEGRWGDGVDPLSVLRDYEDPVLCLTHPNNWCSGASLWADRLVSGLLPKPSYQRGRWRLGVRTGDDFPPSAGAAVPLPGPLVATPRVRSAPSVRSFEPIADSLRREILRYYYDRGEPFVSDSALRTLETNSGLAESRAATLEHVLRTARVFSVRGQEVLDLGCGFGALALVFAARGARVTALDPNAERLNVGALVAERHGLQVNWKVGGMDTTELGQANYDVALMNNSFCYLVAQTSRERALASTLDALRAGGVLAVRDPSRFRLRDQFTGVPLVGLLPPGMAQVISRRLLPGRSRVRLLSTTAARRELREAGFVEVRSVAPPGRSRLVAAFAAYHHLVARKPISSGRG